jgi:hypothetical protein
MRAQIVVFCGAFIVASLLPGNICAQSTLAQEPPAVEVSPQQKAAEERYRQQVELIESLAEKHDYKLGEDELLKFIYDPQTEEREKLRALVSNMTFFGGGETRLIDASPKYEPSMLLFRQLETDTLVWQSMNLGISTLADVLANVMNLRRQQFDCPPNMLLTYMPGDWVLSWDPNQPHELSDTEIAAFERILNEKFNLGVRVKWKTATRPTIVLTGKYKAMPKNPESQSAEASRQADGWFEIPVRRSEITGSAGRYDELLQAIGEALMLPVIDEATERPTKSGFFWQYPDEQKGADYRRLDAEDEQRVLESLHEQLGYDFAIEPREVRLLSIEPRESSK